MIFYYLFIRFALKNNIYEIEKKSYLKFIKNKANLSQQNLEFLLEHHTLKPIKK
jgi:hypothetical protein